MRQVSVPRQVSERAWKRLQFRLDAEAGSSSPVHRAVAGLASWLGDVQAASSPRPAWPVCTAMSCRGRGRVRAAVRRESQRPSLHLEEGTGFGRCRHRARTQSWRVASCSGVARYALKKAAPATRPHGGRQDCGLPDAKRPSHTHACAGHRTSRKASRGAGATRANGEVGGKRTGLRYRLGGGYPLRRPEAGPGSLRRSPPLPDERLRAARRRSIVSLLLSLEVAAAPPPAPSWIAVAPRHQSRTVPGTPRVCLCRGAMAT